MDDGLLHAYTMKVTNTSFLVFSAFPAFSVRSLGVRALGFAFTMGFLSTSSNGGNLRRSNNYIFVVNWG
jgi:hypothetical protein